MWNHLRSVGDDFVVVVRLVGMSLCSDEDDFFLLVVEEQNILISRVELLSITISRC